MKNMSLLPLLVAVLIVGNTIPGVAFAGGSRRLKDARSFYNVGKASFDVSTHVIGTAPKPNPFTTGYQLGRAAGGFAQGVRQGATYQNWQKPDVISAAEGARTIGYTTGVLGRRAVDAVRDRARRR